MSEAITRQRIAVTGVVQGVGFRPFVYGLAQRLGLSGFVGNDGSGVFIEAEGPQSALDILHEALRREVPPMARVESVRAVPIPVQGEHGFRIVASRVTRNTLALVSPDLATCPDCLRELFDPANRRYRYPFINCTQCGPRFTIIRMMPYDRLQTTMAGFEMCPACKEEYHSAYNRRFHAQPNACPVCGPQITFVSPGKTPQTGEAALSATGAALKAGQVVAIKGIGGFHLACDAANPAAVTTLRARKGREAKPLAVMCRDLEMAGTLAHIDRDEARLLSSTERPIVLLRKKGGFPLAEGIAPDNPDIGVMLPYSPLHHLLLADSGAPLVMTSGNFSEEPILFDESEAQARLSPAADAFLLHDRPIHIPCDDSVVRVFEGRELPIRRSRGYAPFPARLPIQSPPLLAVGGELKNTFCLAQGEYAFLSQHIGDMENLPTLSAFERALAHMEALFGIQPERIACDLHPGYLSTRQAEKTAEARGLPLLRVQHHHAHIAAVMAEHGLSRAQAVIGFAFDGTGYGPDGAIWGGEALIADYAGYRRAAHLAYVPLPGGDAAIKRPYRTALAHLWAAGISWDEDLPPVQAASEEERRILPQQMARGLNSKPTSSMGRLFDAAASLIGIGQIAHYEAQAAILLEAVAESTFDGYDFAYTGGETISPAPVWAAMIQDHRAGVSTGVMAGRFIQAVADLMLRVALTLRKSAGLNTVALSGGVFQNVKLLRLCVPMLREAGFSVLTHQHVPPNDGGLALGQAVLGAFAGDKLR